MHNKNNFWLFVNIQSEHKTVFAIFKLGVTKSVNEMRKIKEYICSNEYIETLALRNRNKVNCNIALYKRLKVTK